MAFFTVSGVVLVAALVVFRAVLLPFFLAVVLAYVLAPLVRFLENLPLGRFKPERWVAVLSLYVSLLGLLTLLVVSAVPRLLIEVQQLAIEAPRLAQSVQQDWLPAVQRKIDKMVAPYVNGFGGKGEPEAAIKTKPRNGRNTVRVVQRTPGVFDIYLPANSIDVVKAKGGGYRVQMSTGKRNGKTQLSDALHEWLNRSLESSESYALTAFKTIQTVLFKVVGGVFDFFITLMLSAYLLITSDRIFDFFKSLVRPTHRARFDRLLYRIDRGLTGVIRGQLVICVINGVLSGIGFYMFKLKYWPILTLIAAVLSLIPIFGAIISSVPAIIIALQQGIAVALLVLLWTVGIHQLEANLLNPTIMGDAARVHPVLVVFALLAGEHLFGIVGALLAVPILSITQNIFLHYREVALGVSAPMTVPPPANPAN